MNGIDATNRAFASHFLERSELHCATVLLKFAIESTLFSDNAPGHDNDRTVACPHCLSSAAVKRGKDARERQRYICRSCKRSFTATSTTALSHNKVSAEAWKRFATCHVIALSLRNTAIVCGVSLKTAFHMRKRVFAIMQQAPQQERATNRKTAADQGLAQLSAFHCDVFHHANAERAGSKHSTAQSIGARCPAASRPNCTVHLASQLITQVARGRLSASISVDRKTFLSKFRRVGSGNYGHYCAWFDWLCLMQQSVEVFMNAMRIVDRATRRRSAVSES